MPQQVTLAHRQQFADLLKHFRARHGLSQEAAARLVPTSDRNWRHWESATHYPYYRLLQMVYAMLDAHDR